MTASRVTPQRRRVRGDLLALAVACLVTLGFALFVAAPGHASIDEVTYHLMVRDLWVSGSFDMLTGYQELPSAAYVTPVTVVRDGHLVSQYPALHSILALPFYALAGYRGLFLLNALAFCATLLLVHATARKVAPERLVALGAGLIYVFATFAWDYAIAAWPHALATLFVTGAVYLALRGLLAEEPRAAIGWAFGAGLAVGFGVGVRVDVIFAMAALTAPFLFTRPARWIAALAALAGTLPGLAVVAWINYERYGIASPFTYGRDPSGSSIDPLSYLPMLVLGLAGVALVWAVTQPHGRALIGRHRRSIVVAGAIAAALALWLLWGLFARIVDGVFQLLVDLRIRDLSIEEGGLTRGPGGGMVYMGHLKKSLLQSCPYLVLLTLPIWMVVTGRRNALPLALLLLVPAAFIGAYGYFAWHGGLSLNLRYFTPILPATSILAAVGFRELRRRALGGRARARQGALLAMLLLISSAILGFALGDDPLASEEFAVLTLPLVLAAAILVALALSFAPEGGLRIAGARSGLALALAGCFWAGTIAFAYDVPIAWIKRAYGTFAAESLAPAIAADALLLVDRRTLVGPLFERGDISIAEPARDGFASFRALIDHHFAAGRPVYALFDPPTWTLLQERGLLGEVALTQLTSKPNLSLFRLEPPAVANGGDGEGASQRPQLSRDPRPAAAP